MTWRRALGVPIILIMFSTAGHAQAAAEAALANAHSSTTAIKAGSMLGRALNQGNNQLGGRIERIIPTPAQEHGPQVSGQLSARTNSSTLPSTVPGGSSLIVSVKGGEPACASTQDAKEKNAAGAAKPGCSSKTAAGAKPQTQYKSAVTLSFPK